ncbi:MAG: hypothetical protein KAH48_05805 [Chlorobi bacterium]|nr:hypothetical protein [Chlorobiota bacterium]
MTKINKNHILILVDSACIPVNDMVKQCLGYINKKNSDITLCRIGMLTLDIRIKRRTTP